MYFYNCGVVFDYICMSLPPCFANHVLLLTGLIEAEKILQQAEGGSTRWGRAVCGLRSPLKRYLSDVEVKLHNMHMHDQVFITNNDEHVEV